MKYYSDEAVEEGLKCSPGATYPYVPASIVSWDELGFRGLAVPKSETNASNSKFKRMLLLDISR